MTILLVEDQVELRAVLADALGNAGFRVIEAASGEEATTVATTLSSLDVVISDIDLPGVKGHIASMEIMRHHPLVKIILMSGGCEYDPELGKLTRQRGIPLLTKPFGVRDLVALLPNP